MDSPKGVAAKESPRIELYRRHPQGSQPKSLFESYRATLSRAPHKPLVLLPHTLSEITGPVYGHQATAENDNDLTRQHAGEPLGERIVVSGHVLDSNGRPVSNTLIEIWQANSAGRYRHAKDSHPAPLDPNFSGSGRVLTDASGAYRFVTIKPGPYPWLNHFNAWRPAHIHFSVFGAAFITRLVTQMYFPGDPLLGFDPIFQSVPDEKARQRMVARFDLETTEPQWATGYKFNIVLRGPAATPFET
jgi:protocatechuate 3,4-dioxygenase beta subunit